MPWNDIVEQFSGCMLCGRNGIDLWYVNMEWRKPSVLGSFTGMNRRYVFYVSSSGLMKTLKLNQSPRFIYSQLGENPTRSKSFP